LDERDTGEVKRFRLRSMRFPLVSEEKRPEKAELTMMVPGA
jgi:hypothetical protein